jgi:ubiquinone/menaquinone biosynthesis C-methylase UbiE
MEIDDRYLYDKQYFLNNYSGDLKRDIMYRQEYKRIVQHVPNGGDILDIGCGVGNFLDIFDDCWERYGIEPSTYARKEAISKGIEIFDNIEAIKSYSMDVVVMRGTFQHINFPMHTLVHATRVLAVGGLLVILATPDTDSLVYKIWGNLPMLDPDRNWILPGSKMLVNIIRRLGYKNIEVLHPYLETPYAKPIIDLSKFIASLFFGYKKFAFPGNSMEIYAVKEG